MTSTSRRLTFGHITLLGIKKEGVKPPPFYDPSFIFEDIIMAALLPLDLVGGENIVDHEFTIAETFASRFLVLPVGPFFTKGTFIRDLSTNKMLRPWLDYKLVHLDNTLSRASKQEICSVIFIRNTQVKNVRVTAMATGGWDNTEVAGLKANLATWVSNFDEHIGWAQHMDRAVQAHPIIHLSRVSGDTEWQADTVEMELQFLRQTVQDGDTALSAHIMRWLEYTYAEVEANLEPMRQEILQLLNDVFIRNQRNIGEFVWTDDTDNSLLNRPGFWEEYNNTALQDAGDNPLGYQHALQDGDFVRAHATGLYQRVEELESANFVITLDKTFYNEGETAAISIKRLAGDVTKLLDIDVISKQKGYVGNWKRTIAQNATINLNHLIPKDYDTNGDDTLTVRIRQHPGFYKYVVVRDSSHTVDWTMRVITRDSKHVAEAGSPLSTQLLDLEITRSYAAFNTSVWIHLSGDISPEDMVNQPLTQKLDFNGNTVNILHTLSFIQDDLNDEESEKIIVRLSSKADPKDEDAILKEVVLYLGEAPKLTHTQLRWSSKADGSDNIGYCNEGDTVYLIGQLGHDLSYNPSIPKLIIESESLAETPDDYILIEPPVILDNKTVAWRCQVASDLVRDSHQFEVLTVRTGMSNTSRLFIHDISYPIKVNMKWTANPNRYADEIGVASEDMLFFLHVDVDTLPPGTIANISLNTGDGDPFATAKFDTSVAVFNDYARIMFNIEPDYTYTGDKNLIVRFSVGGQNFSSPIIKILDTTLPFVDLRFVDTAGNVITEVNEGGRFKIQVYNHSMTRTTLPEIITFANDLTTVSLDDFEGNLTSVIDTSKWGIVRKWIDLQPNNYIEVKNDALTEGDENLQIRIKFPDTLEGGQVVPTGEESIFNLLIRDTSVNPLYNAYIAKSVGGIPLTLINEGESYFYVATPNTNASTTSVASAIPIFHPNTDSSFVPTNEISLDTVTFYPTATEVNGVTLPAGSIVQRFLINKIYRDDGIRKFGRGAKITMIGGTTYNTGLIVVNVEDTFQQPKLESLTFDVPGVTGVSAADEGVEVTVRPMLNTYGAPGKYTLQLVDSLNNVLSESHPRDSLPEDEYIHDGATNFIIRPLKFMYAENYRTDGDREVFVLIKYSPITTGAFTPVTFKSPAFTIVDSSTEPQVLGGWVREDTESSGTIIEANEGETVYLRFALVNVAAGEIFNVTMRGGAGISATDYKILSDTFIESNGSNVYWHYIPVEIVADMQTEGIENLIAVLQHEGSDFEAVYPINIGDTSRGVDVNLYSTGKAIDVLDFNTDGGTIDFETTSLSQDTPYRYYFVYKGKEYVLLDYTENNIEESGTNKPNTIFIPTLEETIVADFYLEYTLNGNRRTLGFGERTLTNQLSMTLMTEDAPAPVWNGGFTFNPKLQVTGNFDKEVRFLLRTYRDPEMTIPTTLNTLGTNIAEHVQVRPAGGLNTGDVSWVDIVPEPHSFNEYSNSIYMQVEVFANGDNTPFAIMEGKTTIPNFMGGASKSSVLLSENVYGHIETEDYYLSTLDTPSVVIFGQEGHTVRFWVDNTFGYDVNSLTPVTEPYLYTIPATGPNVVNLPWNFTDLTLQESIINPSPYIAIKSEMISHVNDEMSTIVDHFRIPVSRPWGLNVTIKDDFENGNLFTIGVSSAITPYHNMSLDDTLLFGKSVSWSGLPLFSTPSPMTTNETTVGTIYGFNNYTNYNYTESSIKFTGTSAKPAPYTLDHRFPDSFFDNLIGISPLFSRGDLVIELTPTDGRVINSETGLEFNRHYQLTIDFDRLPKGHSYTIHACDPTDDSIISTLGGVKLVSNATTGMFTFPLTLSSDRFADYASIILYLVDETSLVRWYGTRVNLLQNSALATINFYTDTAYTKPVSPTNRPHSGENVYLVITTENVADGERIDVEWREVADFNPTDFQAGTVPEEITIVDGKFETTLRII